MLKDYPGIYDIDENGVVTNLKTGRILKPSSDTNGYHQVNLYRDGKPKMHAVHRLVAEKYLSNFCMTLQVDHIDQCKTNNAASNLRMATNQQNQFNRTAKGYFYDKKLGKYVAYIYLNRKRIHLGVHELEADAAAAYAAAKVKYHTIVIGA